MKTRRVYVGLIAVIIAGFAAGSLFFARSGRVCFAATPGAPAGLAEIGNSAQGTSPYGSKKFDYLLKESYEYCGGSDYREFYFWFDSGYAKSHAPFPGKEGLTLEQVLAVKRDELKAIHQPWARTKAELEACAWSHKLIKDVITKFSLDNGFEFYKTVHQGQRQCFLQATLIAGLLDDMGIDAGVVMVNENPTGGWSNNGHAVTLARLANGQQVLVDASDKEPFQSHQGLFVKLRTRGKTGGYLYVKPVYVGTNTSEPKIISYRTLSKGYMVSNKKVVGMDFAFMLSQFWYYRGERSVGGILANSPTPEGLKRSQEALEKSVRLSSENPLAAYMLGRVYLIQGENEKAAKTLKAVAADYARYGWVPEGPKMSLALVQARIKRTASNKAAQPK